MLMAPETRWFCSLYLHRRVIFAFPAIQDRRPAGNHRVSAAFAGRILGCRIASGEPTFPELALKTECAALNHFVRVAEISW